MTCCACRCRLVESAQERTQQMDTKTMTHALVKCARRLSPDTWESNMEPNMNELQMASCCSDLSHRRSEEIVHGAQQNPSLHLTRKLPPRAVSP